MALPRLSRQAAEKQLRHCLDEGIVIPGRHFRAELAQEGIRLEAAWAVLRAGSICDEPEPDIKTGEWKYRVEGFEPNGRWLAIVFCFKEHEKVFLITVFSIQARRHS